MALTDPILSRDATVAETAAEQLRAIREELADTIAEEFRQAHARYEALCKETHMQLSIRRSERWLSVALRWRLINISPVRLIRAGW